MSKLICDDIRAVKALSPLGIKRTPIVGVRPLSPFSEFDDTSEPGDLHLGDCPGLTQVLCGTQPGHVKLVLFSVVAPDNGHNPFIVFFVSMACDDRWSFPVSCYENGMLGNDGHSIMRTLGVSHNVLGFFRSSDDDVPYMVCELAMTHDRDGHLCGNSGSCGVWVTANEVLGGEVLGSLMSECVTRFITRTGEGMSRLYRNGEFIPAPEVYYAPLGVIEKGMTGDHLSLGDLAYAVVMTFFKTDDSEGKGIPDSVFDVSVMSGTVVRLVVWEGGYRRTGFALESVSTGDRCCYDAVEAERRHTCVMSAHTGCLTTVACDAVTVVNRKMFIFE